MLCSRIIRPCAVVQIVACGFGRIVPAGRTAHRSSVLGSRDIRPASVGERVIGVLVFGVTAGGTCLQPSVLCTAIALPIPDTEIVARVVNGADIGAAERAIASITVLVAAVWRVPCTCGVVTVSSFLCTADGTCISAAVL